MLKFAKKSKIRKTTGIDPKNGGKVYASLYCVRLGKRFLQEISESR
uniref:Uncharacterized protein n=1 Tax=Romanomermis culicivorax TaxID=13658 RepID=A0A915K3H6_ROMCU